MIGFKHQLAAQVTSMNILPQCIMLWDRSLCCVSINRSTSHNFLALDSAFVDKQFFSDLPISDEHRALIRRAMDGARTSGRQAEIKQNLTIDNRLVEIDTAVVPQFEDDQFIGLLTICHRTRAEAKNNNNVWENLCAVSSEPYFMLRQDGTVMRANRDFFNKSAQEWVNQSFDQSFNLEDRQIFNAGLKRVVETGELVRFETSKGERAFVVTLMKYVGGTPNTILVRLDEVTRFKQLRVVEEGRLALLNDALSGADEGMFLFHVSGKVVFRNKAAQKLFPELPQYAVDLVKVLKNRIYSANTKELIDPLDLGLFEALHGQTTVKDRFILKRSDELFTLESTAQPLDRGEGTGAYTIWVLRDVSSDAKRIAGLKEVNARMDSFVRAAAHDLQTPVNNIHNLSKLLVRAESTEAKNSISERITESATVLHELLEGLMQLAEAKVVEDVSAHDIDLEAVVKSVLSVLQSDLEEINAKVVLQLDAQYIKFNATCIRSIIFNLLTNAIKYRAEHRNLELTITSQTATNGIWFSVVDNGIGIDLSKSKSELFKPFKRFTEKGNGKGIGLSLVKSFVEQNGGEIMVESTPDRGSCFKLLLRSCEPQLTQYGLFD